MPFTLRDEVDFWGRQMSEHALFLSMLLTDPALKSEASQLHTEWERVRKEVARAPNDQAIRSVITRPLATIIAYKRNLLNRLMTGEFLGFAYPLFVQHTLIEADFLQKRALGQGTTDAETVHTSLQLSGDHAKFAAHLLDPSETDLVASADVTGDQIYRMMKVPTPLNQIAAATDGLANWLISNNVGAGKPRPLSIIPAVLANHVVREQRRFTQMIQEISARPR